ncbi:MAG: hypothetical protein ACHQUA_02290 [Microgenomates group bacterium]
MAIDKKLERILSEEEVKGIIGHAEALRSVAGLDRAQEVGIISLREGVSVSRLYEIAQEVDIPKEYIDRAIASRYQSPREMREQLEEIGARPSSKIVNNYKIKTIRNRLLSSLQNTFPSDEFLIEGDESHHPFDGWAFFYLVKKVGKAGFFSGQRTERIAYVNGNSDPPKIDIYSPVFVQGCKEAVKILEEKFGVTKKTVHYNVYGDEEF